MPFKTDKQRKAFFAMKGANSKSAISPQIINMPNDTLRKKGIVLNPKKIPKSLRIVFGKKLIRTIGNPALKRRDDLKFGKVGLAIFESRKNKGQFFRPQLIGNKFISISNTSKITIIRPKPPKFSETPKEGIRLAAFKKRISER